MAMKGKGECGGMKCACRIPREAAQVRGIVDRGADDKVERGGFIEIDQWVKAYFCNMA